MTNKNLVEFGLTKDVNCSKLKEVLKNNIKLKEIHIDIYPTNPLINHSTPFMLLLRTIEKKVIVRNDGIRLILKKVIDNFDTHLINILFSEVIECYYLKDDYYMFILNIQNIYYKITIYN